MTVPFARPLCTGLLLICLLAGCSSPAPGLAWSNSGDEVTGTRPQETTSIALDVYLDGTSSMKGFAISSQSVYSQFLDQLETSARSAWRNTDVKLYKFGAKIKPIDRTAFLSAKTDPHFYEERGIFKQTFIDSVVRRTDTGRLSVLITDLFQNEGDVVAMIDQFKQQCFARGVAVGIAGMESAFDGTVFDAPSDPSYPLKTAHRPFYAIIFGNPYNMDQLFEALKTKPFVREEQFLTISRHIVRSYHVALTKAKESAALTNKKARTEVENSFDFGMKKTATEARMNLTLDIERNPRCADFSEKSIEVAAFKKTAVRKKGPIDSVATGEVTLENIKRAGSKITATLVLHNTDGKGNYSYLVYLRLNPLNAWRLPAWIGSFSTTGPIRNTPTADRTYNLEKLCAALLVANASITPPSISKFYINLFKR